MKTANKNWLALMILAALSGACGDSGSGNNDGDGSNGGGNNGDNSGGNNGEVDAGMTPMGDLGPDDVTPQQCGAQADGTPLDTSKGGGCFYFYCYQTEQSLLAEAKDGGGCASATDVAIQCEGLSVRTVSDCARENSAVLAGNGEEAYRKAVTECARGYQELAEFSDSCLGCNVDSSVCAARRCLIECVTGDSQLCDKCREDNKCTPEFYDCAGLPNPNK